LTGSGQESGKLSNVSRLFVAVWPSAGVSERLAALPRHDEPGVRWTAGAKLHVTVRFLGDADLAESAARLAAAELPAVTARYGPRVERLGPRLLVVPVTGLEPLADAVRTATAGLGRDDQRPFRGHVTIARTQAHAPSAALGVAIEGEQLVTEVTLVASEQNRSGSVYTTAGTFATR